MKIKTARRLRARLWASAALVGAAAIPLGAQAQSQPKGGEPGAGPSVSEVVITAEKRSERLVDTPMSVSAISGAQLESIHSTSIEDWAGYVPGLNLAQSGSPGLATLAIDGISPIGAATEVGVYINDTPIGSSNSYLAGALFAIDLMPYDLNQIEVLRGPQGTLYGASTMGGVVKYDLALPDLDKFTGRIGGDVFGVQNGDGPGGGVRGMVNLPLVTDQLALRASGYFEHTPGFIDDATTGQKADNPLRQGGGRLALEWKPSADFTAVLGAIYQYTHADNLDIVALNPATDSPMYGPLSNLNSLAEPFTQELQLYDLTLNWNLHWATLSSVSSYQTFTDQTSEDLTPYIGVYLGYFGAPGPGYANLNEEERLKKYTQEIRLASPQGQKFEWLVGGFYTHETGTNYQVLNAFSSPGVALTALQPLEEVHLPSTYEEVAVFGNATYHFTDWFDLSAGVRYAHNTQDFTETVFGALVGPGTGPIPGHSSEGVTTFAVAPSLHLNKNTLAYARIATGYQPGGPNVVLPGVTALPPTFGSSRLIDYQVGLKSTLLDGRASVDLSAFYIDWTKIQVVASFGGQSGLENGGTARSEGFDASGRWSPVRGLTFGSSLTYTDAILTTPVASIGAAYGARLPLIPLWAGSLTADYVRPIDQTWTGFIGGGWRYTGSRYSGVQGSSTGGELSSFETSAFGVIDLHGGARTHDLTLTLFVKNLANRRAYLPSTGDTGSGPFYSALGTEIDVKAPVLQPRTIGLSIDKSF